MRFYVARPLDDITRPEGFRVRILTITEKVDDALSDLAVRKGKGATDLVIITDPAPDRRQPRQVRQIITAKVGPGTPGSPRYLSGC